MEASHPILSWIDRGIFAKANPAPHIEISLDLTLGLPNIEIGSLGIGTTNTTTEDVIEKETPRLLLLQDLI